VQGIIIMESGEGTEIGKYILTIKSSVLLYFIYIFYDPREEPVIANIFMMFDRVLRKAHRLQSMSC